VSEVVRGWANVMARYNPAWSRPPGALGQCESATWRFRMWMEDEHGVASEVVTRRNPPHVAVYVRGLIVDFTMRQFHPDAAYPWFGNYEEWNALLDCCPNPD